MLELSLKNYRRFVHQDALTFSPGLTIITGPNGAGKTTLAEAFSYALFGAIRGRGGASVRSDNAVGIVEVQCTLQIDGHCVKVSRRGDTAELSIDGTQQVASQAGSIHLVNQRLRKLLGGLTREQFEDIYVAEQGETAGLLTKANDRAKVLEVALQLDVLRKACALQEERRKCEHTIVVTKGGTIADRLSLATEERAKWCVSQKLVWLGRPWAAPSSLGGGDTNES